MFQIKFKVNPKPQPRQRHYAYKTPDGKVKSKNYTKTDEPANVMKSFIRYTAVEYMKQHNLKALPKAVPIFVTITFVFDRLASHRKEGGRIVKATKPDIDNLAKGVLDALNGTLYHDDGQVAGAVLLKQFAASDEEPCIEFGIHKTMHEAIGAVGGIDARGSVTDRQLF